MIYVTGDTHGQIDISKLFPGSFPDGKILTRDDYMIICGDFGGIWFGDGILRREKIYNSLCGRKP